VSCFFEASPRRVACWVLCAVASLAPITGAAQTPVASTSPPKADPDAGCNKLLGQVKNDCDERDKLKGELDKLAPPAPAPAAPPGAPPQPNAPNPETEQRRRQLTARIAELEASPFNPWCGGWSTAKVKPCDALASLLETEIEGLVVRKEADAGKPSAEERAKAEYLAEPDRRTATNAAGTRAQRDAVESVQPINLAGGAISLAGTRTGTQGVATVTVNPLALGDPDDPALRRLFDLSVTAPFAMEGAGDEDSRFIGVRARANATAPYSSAALRAALTRFYALAGNVADELEERLRTAPDVRLCALDIIATRQVTLAACGSGIDLTELTRAREESYAAIREAQREADRYYLGLDLRGDFGDPTGDAVTGDDGTSLLGTVAAGLRLPLGEAWDFELRVRGGGDYFRSRDSVNGFRPAPVFSFDWGGALILGGHATLATEKQRLAFGVGVEGRHTGENRSSDLAPTNYVNFNAMIIVPVASGGDLGLSFSVPLMDSEVPRGTVIAVSTDLGLLDGSGSR
jgi:hypothetical protein